MSGNDTDESKSEFDGENSFEGLSGPGERRKAFYEERFGKPRFPDLTSKVAGPNSLSAQQAITSETDVEFDLPFDDLPKDYLINKVLTFRERQRSARTRSSDDAAGLRDEGPEMRTYGARLRSPGNSANWLPIGPSIVLRGQSANEAGMAGRVARIAVDANGRRIYAATAVGGVWRSDDGGASWISTMDDSEFVLNLPSGTNRTGIVSLSCGAIAVDPNNKDRLYVGTGEGDTWGLYYGYGPLVSNSGGLDGVGRSAWQPEQVDPADSLNGQAFFALAIDPADGNHVIAATTNGLYRRELSGSGFHWSNRNLTFQPSLPPGGQSVFCSAVAARDVQNNRTCFFGARWGGSVHRSFDGRHWEELPAFPTTPAYPISPTGTPPAIARLGLSVQPDNPSVVYALAANEDGMFENVWRLDDATSALPQWSVVAGAPSELFGKQRGQGMYDLVICVDPKDVNQIYLGGSATFVKGGWSAALYACRIARPDGRNQKALP